MGPIPGPFLAASCSYAPLLDSSKALSPSIGIAFELGHGAAVWDGGAIGLRHKQRLSNSLAVEVSVQLPLGNISMFGPCCMLSARQLRNTVLSSGLATAKLARATFQHFARFCYPCRVPVA